MIFGFPGPKINPRTGRPEPNQMWLGAKVENWVAWLMAASMLGMTIYAMIQSKWDDVPLLILFTGVIWALALWRQLLWVRTIQKFKLSKNEYDDGLRRAFSNFDETNL